MEQVRCPRCGQRLFDISRETTGTISTFCRRCKTAVVFDHSFSQEPCSKIAVKAPEPNPQAPNERN